MIKGLPLLAFIAMLILQATGTLNLSWWVITAPLWLYAAWGLLVFVIIVFVALMAAVLGKDTVLDGLKAMKRR